MANDAARIAALFTRADGAFRFSRWDRPLAPVIVGTDDDGIRIFEQAIATVAGLAGIRMAEFDPDTAANFLVFFVNEWSELAEIPTLGEIIPDIAGLAKRLAKARASRYRVFGFDEDGAICACISLIRYGTETQQVSAQTLATTEAYQGMLLWSEGAFEAESPVALEGEQGLCVVKPWFADLLRVAYDPVIPGAGLDRSLALRLAARMPAPQDQGAGA